MSSGEGFEPLVETLKLPDPDDRHVYACVQRIAESRRNPPEDVLALGACASAPGWCCR